MSDSSDLIYRYWGKARPDDETGPAYHLLPYHCLDVAAVGKILLEKNPFLLKRLSRLSSIEENTLKTILVFFLALHDLEKFSESFQYVVPDLFKKLQGKAKSQKQPYSRKNFGHDSIGFLLWKDRLFKQVIKQMIDKYGRVGNENDWWDLLKWFMEASNGHHCVPEKNQQSDSDFFNDSVAHSVLEFVYENESDDWQLI